jgi:hypothetical protein
MELTSGSVEFGVPSPDPGSAILHAHVPVSLSGAGVPRAVAGAGLYLTVLERRDA